MVISLVDVMAGFIITARTAQRDIQIERDGRSHRLSAPPVHTNRFPAMSRDFHLPGRSPVIAGEGMAATSHPLATLAAIDVMRLGGNAVDAAVTAVAVLCVIEPHMTGIGGDCFALIAEPGKPVWGYNGCGRSGAKASTEALLAKGMRAIEPTSPHAVNVPGAIEAWDAILKAHGTLALDRALAPAIHYAEHGFPVAARVAVGLEGPGRQARQQPGRDQALSVRTATRPSEGDIVKLPALAATLQGDRQGRPARVLRRRRSPRTWWRRLQRWARC